MGFRINTNVAAMNAHMYSLNNNKKLDDSLAKLSSGLRINKAADDASGLAIADQLGSQATGLGQAIRNANDGINLAQTADGALGEYSNIISTIKTKSIQAASDGQNADSRQAIQSDIDKLLEEAQNIASTTSFNGQTLLNGGFHNKNFHVGAYSGQTVSIDIANTQTANVSKFAMEDGTTAVGTTGGTAHTISVSVGGTAVSVTVNNTTGNTSLQNAQALVDAFNAAAQSAGVSVNATAVETTAGTGNYTIRLDSGDAFSTNATGGVGLTTGTQSTSLSNNLSTIDVTTRAGAEKAIITSGYALRDIDKVRSNIGSVQNQLDSTVKNISVTQVNVTAAESSIRDVDFAQESADFSKYNILAQSGSYAMSQANAVQQNVLRLLQ